MFLVWMFAWSIFSLDPAAGQPAVHAPRDPAAQATIEKRILASKAAVSALKRAPRAL